MKELTDQQIADMMVVTLNNNASIIQLASQVYGTTPHMKREQQKRVNKQFMKLWHGYRDQMALILEEKPKDS